LEITSGSSTVTSAEAGRAATPAIAAAMSSRVFTSTGTSSTPQRTGSPLHGLKNYGVREIGRIDDNGDSGQRRDRFFDQLDALGADLGQERCVGVDHQFCETTSIDRI
jgi:hypothetical protein